MLMGHWPSLEVPANKPLDDEVPFFVEIVRFLKFQEYFRNTAFLITNVCTEAFYSLINANTKSYIPKQRRPTDHELLLKKIWHVRTSRIETTISIIPKNPGESRSPSNASVKFQIKQFGKTNLSTRRRLVNIGFLAFSLSLSVMRIRDSVLLLIGHMHPHFYNFVCWSPDAKTDTGPRRNKMSGNVSLINSFFFFFIKMLQLFNKN